MNRATASGGASGPDRRFPSGAPGRPVKLEDIARSGEAEGSGVLDRMVSGFRGLWGRKAEKRKGTTADAAPAAEIPHETPQELEARAALLPPGVSVQSYAQVLLQ